MRIFADANFLISAFLTRGLSAELLERILEEDDYHLLVGEVVLLEFERVMISKIKIPPEKVSYFTSYLKRFEFIKAPTTASSYKLGDPDDLWVLANAIEANADVLITGDKHFREKRDSIKEIKIYTPREFWEKNI